MKIETWNIDVELIRSQFEDPNMYAHYLTSFYLKYSSEYDGDNQVCVYDNDEKYININSSCGIVPKVYGSLSSDVSVRFNGTRNAKCIHYGRNYHGSDPMSINEDVVLDDAQFKFATESLERLVVSAAIEMRDAQLRQKAVKEVISIILEDSMHITIGSLGSLMNKEFLRGIAKSED